MAEQSVVTVVPTTTPGTEMNEADTKGSLGEIATGKSWQSLFDFFGYNKESDRQSQRHQEALSAIWDYAAEVAESKDKDSIMMEVIRLKHRLGGASIGEKPYFKMLMYIRHHNIIKQRDAAMRALESGQ